jgi:AraC-like DNA-binding protein
MEHGRHSMDVVARETGFSDRDRMRRAFLRAFGQPPQVIRRNSRGITDTPASSIPIVLDITPTAMLQEPW